MVKAAVVNSYGSTPIYTDFTLDPPSDAQVRIRVLSAGFHNLVRSRALGKHPTVSHLEPPHIPGVDGVGTTDSGEIVYFISLYSPKGSFAEEINVAKHNVYKLPAGADTDAVAVLANPIMSSWMALTARAGIEAGRTGWSVAVVGATGVSGHAAIQVARAMGAEKVVAIGKAGSKLDATKALGATHTVALGDGADFAAVADVDVVLDYLWGTVAETAMGDILLKRGDRNQRLTWVHIGALAGREAKIAGERLRMANLVVMGCGPGSWSYQDLDAQLPSMLEAIAKGGFKVEFKVEKLSEVETWWGETDGPRKLVKP